MSHALAVSLMVVLVMSSLNFTAGAAWAKKLDGGAGPDAWVGDLSPISKTDWNYDRRKF